VFRVEALIGRDIPEEVVVQLNDFAGVLNDGDTTALLIDLVRGDDYLRPRRLFVGSAARIQGKRRMSHLFGSCETAVQLEELVEVDVIVKDEELDEDRS